MLHHLHREPAGELAVHPDVVVCEDVAHPHLGDDREAALIHRADPGVRVRVDEPRCDMLAGGVDDDRATRRGEPAADLRDLAGTDEEVRILETTLRALGPDGRVAHQEDGGLLRDRRPTELDHRADEGEIDGRHLLRHRAARRAGVRLGAGALEGRVGAVRERGPAIDLLTADGARHQHGALVAEGLAIEGDLESTRLGNQAHGGEWDLLAAHALDRPTDPVDRPLEAKRGVEAVCIGGGDGPGPTRVDLRRARHAIARALHPDVADARVLRKEIPFRDDEVRDLAHRDGAMRTVDAEPARRYGGECGERLVGGQPA